MLDLALGLRAAGVDVRLACPLPSALAERAADRGLTMTNIKRRGLLDPATIRALAELLRTGTINLVHAHNGRTALLAALALKLAGKGFAVATQHFIEPAQLSRRGVTALISERRIIG